MKEKVKVRGKFRLYLQWPLYLSALFIIMGLFVGLVSVKAGIIVSSFTVVYVGIALWIYFSRKRGIAAAMVEDVYKRQRPPICISWWPRG